jgi:glycosyltransferase involved in cell wall biosynthesis
MYNKVPKDQLVLCYYKTNQFDKAEKLAEEIKGHDQRILNNIWWARTKTKQKIFFTLGITPEPIWGGILETQGVHGVETTYIELPKEFARKGYDVFLFCNTSQEHVYDGVYYIPYQNLPNYLCLEPDVIITSRWFDALYQESKAKKIIWLQDSHFADPNRPDAFDVADAVVCSSLWHRCYIAERFEHGIKSEKINIIPLGIRKELFTQTIDKVSKKVIYSSNPDRGLYILADMWEELTNRIPGISLSICYGWEGLTTWGQSEEWKASVEGQKAALMNKIGSYPNVTFTGRITKKALAKEMLSSDIMLYCNNVPETFCLSVLEAQISGTPVITTAMGALTNTVDSDLNFLIKGSPYSKEYRKSFIEHSEALLNNENLLKDYQMKNRNKFMAMDCDWSNVVEKWERLIWGL